MRVGKAKGRMLYAVFTVAIAFLSLYTRNELQALLIKERRVEADTVLQLFRKNMQAQLETINYASELSYTIDAGDYSNLELYEKKAAELLSKNNHIVFLSYFEGDMLKAIYPIETYGSETGKNMRDLSYSYTLAKVVKELVIEGPEQVSGVNKKVFLFIYPLLENDQYKGEVVAAVDRDFVVKTMDLKFLDERNYDYEIWRVNALGEKKTVVEISDKKLDFSDAVKQEFSLPATWNLSILPKDGWLPDTMKLAIDISCFGGAILLLAFVYLVARVIGQKKELRKTAFTDPDSGLLNREGFCYYVNRSKHMQSTAVVSLLYIQLHNFHKLCRNVSGEEVQEYLRLIREELQERFPKDSIAAHLSDEEIVVVIFEDTQNEKAMEIIEDFILLLFWKKKIHGKKEFVEPKSCIVRGQANETTAEELLKNAAMRLNELYDLHAAQ